MEWNGNETNVTNMCVYNGKSKEVIWPLVFSWILPLCDDSTQLDTELLSILKSLKHLGHLAA